MMDGSKLYVAAYIRCATCSLIMPSADLASLSLYYHLISIQTMYLWHHRSCILCMMAAMLGSGDHLWQPQLVWETNFGVTISGTMGFNINIFAYYMIQPIYF